MSRVPFKRQLIILVCIITALCIAIPVATFAQGHSSKGEPHHAPLQSTVVQQTDPITNLTKTVITTDAPCSNATPVASSLQPGDQVSIVATETTTDNNEASEQEFLQLQDSANTFNQSVTTFNEITPMVFNVVSPNDQLSACIQQGADGPDGDEQGLITYTIAHTKTITLKGGLETIGKEAKDSILNELKKLPVGVDCVLDFAEDTPVVYLIKADYTLIKLDYQLATTAEPDKQGAEMIDALVGITPKLPAGIGCYQSILSYLSPTASDTCVVQGGASFGACVTNLKKALRLDK